MAELKVGDLVTWRTAQLPNGNQPLGVGNCRIIEFGETADGKPAALIEAFGERVGALVADLHPQDEAA